MMGVLRVLWSGHCTGQSFLFAFWYLCSDSIVSLADAPVLQCCPGRLEKGGPIGPPF